MKNLKSALMIMAILAAVFPLLTCTSLENKTKSSSYVVVENLRGTTADGTAADFLQSDVQKINTTTSQPYVTADTATATLTAHTLDPAPILGVSQYEDVLLTRYIVHYYRSDGKNVEGVDVPYSFEGSVNVLLKVNTATDVSLVVVREVAKLEQPLLNLVSNRDVGVLQVTARIDFYGHDMDNNEVTTTGNLPIFFANYND